MFLVLFLVFGILLTGCSKITDLISRVEDTSGRFIGSVIPIYSYPDEGNTEYQKLYSISVSKRVYVILNPDNGPGSSVDSNYSNLKSRLKEKNYKVVGYVYTGYGSRSITDVTNDINRWYSLYSDVDGIFVDEVSDNSNQITFYRVIYNHVKSNDPSDVVILNPGVVPYNGYFEISDVVVVAEINQREFLDNWSSRGVVKEKSAILIYDVRDKDRVINKAVSENISYIYVTDEQTNTWYRVSKYLRDIVK